ncbi:MAG: hypothetical protein U1D30_13885 [Planctomycetota bacterium]
MGTARIVRARRHYPTISPPTYLLIAGNQGSSIDDIIRVGETLDGRLSIEGLTDQLPSSRRPAQRQECPQSSRSASVAGPSRDDNIRFLRDGEVAGLPRPASRSIKASGQAMRARCLVAVHRH